LVVIRFGIEMAGYSRRTAVSEAGFRATYSGHGGVADYRDQSFFFCA
jgi:hypothetical protein